MDDRSRDRITEGIERARREAARRRAAEQPRGWVAVLVWFGWGALCALLVAVYLWGD